jgi:hyperosmotically inducible protein
MVRNTPSLWFYQRPRNRLGFSFPPLERRTCAVRRYCFRPGSRKIRQIRLLPSICRLGPYMHYRRRMHLIQITKASVLTLALLLAPSAVRLVNAQSTPKKADNTAVNKRDQNPGEATADQQKMNAADREITAKIRRSIMADKALSTYARNVKIISQDGTVTLKGPVRSEDEVKAIVSMATDVTGSGDKVINQMSVKPASKP